MTPYALNLILACLLVLWAFMNAESLLDFGAKIDAYLVLGWRWLTLLPALARMIVVQRYMLWKMRREMRSVLNRPLP